MSGRLQEKETDFGGAAGFHICYSISMHGLLVQANSVFNGDL
jgi:hypothetical protein